MNKGCFMPQWLNDLVFLYEISPCKLYDTNRTVSVDINGIIEKLDYVKRLAVTHWLNPVYDSHRLWT